MDEKFPTHHRNRFLIAMVAYCLTLMASVSYLSGMEIGTLERFIAITPMVPIVFATISLIKAVHDMDELHRRVNQEATATAAIVVGLLTFTYGFLEGVGFPKLEVIWVMPALIFIWGIAKTIIYRRYS